MRGQLCPILDVGRQNNSWTHLRRTELSHCEGVLEAMVSPYYWYFRVYSHTAMFFFTIGLIHY